MVVEKRDGRIVVFDRQKPIDAILKAYKSIDKEITQEAIDKAEQITKFIETQNKDCTVEDIQDIITMKLMSSSRKDVAESFIIYRNNRNIERQKRSRLNKSISKRLKNPDDEKQNANMDGNSFGGKLGAITSDVMKDYALNNCMSRRSKENHLNNIVYIHDLDHFAVGDHNCLSVPVDDLLSKGFNVKQTDVRPANSINTAFQLLAVIFQLQSLQQFGGVSATHLDWTMVPYVRKSFFKHYKDYIELVEEHEIDYSFHDALSIEESDYKVYNPKAYKYAMKKTQKELDQAVEGMYHNLNTLQSRSGNQLPFSSINYGTCTLPEGRMVIKALLDGCIKGVGKLHKTSIFPCGIFQSGKGINQEQGDPNYDLFKLALKSTAKRLYPNYANVDWSGNAGYDKNDPRTYFSTMGCRTANGWDINGFGQLKDGRGNICPVTVIMPTIAMEIIQKDNVEVGKADEQVVDDFLKMLDKKIQEARDMLLERFEYICSQSPCSAKFMWENNCMAGYIPEEGIRSALKHGTLAIGQIGLAETLQILIGCDHTEEKGMELAKRIEELFRDRCKEFKEEYKLNFGVYMTPAENLCFTSMTKFKEKYGEIPNISDKKFFTNSIHVPVWKQISPIEKINIESQLTGYSSAGCITYVELENNSKVNETALEQLVLYAMRKDIPYFALNFPNDTCMNCGYTDEIPKGTKCPKCGSTDIKRLRRITGYLNGDYEESFNEGKIDEESRRFKHSRKWDI